MASSREYFGRVAGQWDSIRREYFGEAVQEAAIARAELSGDAAVVDVGAGTGFMAYGLAPLVGKVICIDTSTEMLDVARQNLGHLSNVRFQIGDGVSLPLSTSTADAVFANMYLHHAGDPLASIKEMVRLLRPGGVLVVTDQDKHDNEWQRVEMADLWLGFEREQIRTWYKAAGLEDIMIECTGQDCSAASQSGSQAKVSIFIATGRKPKETVARY